MTNVNKKTKFNEQIKNESSKFYDFYLKLKLYLEKDKFKLFNLKSKIILENKIQKAEIEIQKLIDLKLKSEKILKKLIDERLKIIQNNKKLKEVLIKKLKLEM